MSIKRKRKLDPISISQKVFRDWCKSSKVVVETLAAADLVARITAVTSTDIELKDQVRRLWVSLLRYGGHAKDCQRPRGLECDCGWDELKKVAKVYAK